MQKTKSVFLHNYTITKIDLDKLRSCHGKGIRFASPNYTMEISLRASTCSIKKESVVVTWRGNGYSNLILRKLL